MPYQPKSISLTNAEKLAAIGEQRIMISLIETLQELIQRLSPLAGVITQVGGQSLKVSQTAVPSTAVTGPITSALSIAEKALGGVSYTQRTAEENLTAIQSNINNIIAK